jgi:hypothetical protein
MGVIHSVNGKRISERKIYLVGALAIIWNKKAMKQQVIIYFCGNGKANHYCRTEFHYTRD